MKILVYDASPDFGGHQLMACLGIEALANDPQLDVLVLTNLQNEKLSARLAEIGGVNILPPELGESAKTLRHTFLTYKPDTILCIQGDIEQSSRAVKTAKRAGIPCISYLALPHTKKEMNAKLGWIRDRLTSGLLNQPDRYIAISESMKLRLIQRGVTRPVTVVPNGVRAPEGNEKSLDLERPVIGLLGRIEFKQKCQNFLVNAFCRHPDFFRSFRMIIRGDGPDRDRLAGLIDTSPRAADIHLEDWNSDRESFFDQIDVLIIPSRYEGVPLVMLEALARGIPVLGTALDGMKDVLPEAWLFKPGDAHSLMQAFSALRECDEQNLREMSEMVRTQMTLENFQKSFHLAVIEAV